tara:strand:+ start:371 stop:1945 length:1575 start_codon:yes stop_codon:yes gene_type:complete
MKPKFVSGPPGTGKTHVFLTKKYQELLQKYDPEKIIMLSHTNVAADELKQAVLDLPEIKEKGLKKKFFKYKICTIHAFCRSKLLKKELVDYADYLNLCRLNSGFKRQRVSQSEFENDKHKFFKFLNDAFGTGKTIKEYWFTLKTTSSNYYPYNNFTILSEMKEVYDEYKHKNQVCDYNDMIHEFNEHAVAPDIDVLIVDEAQDSNVPQIKALKKMSENVKEYYMVGDADQTIFEFAGADAEYFHELSKDAEQLEQGLRCGQTINNLCKEIIKPIWDHYGYSRVWKPVENIIGNHYYLPSLTTNCSAMETLLDKIKNTKETFLFTYRGVPSGKWVRSFLLYHGLEFAKIGRFGVSTYVSKKEIRCHKFWPDFVQGIPMSLKQIKEFWYYMGSKVIVKGKGEATFEDWINKDYTIFELINKNYLKPESVYFKDFYHTRIKSKTDVEKIKYINNLIRQGVDTDGETRVHYANIHTVKGLTYDNVIVDLTCTRPEDYFTQLRLKYVAYSRGRIDCWTIASQDRYTLGE